MILNRRLSYLAFALLAFPVAASASVKCDAPGLLSEFEPEVVTQFIKAEGEMVVPRGSMYAPETAPAFMQIRALESSGVRDYQVRAAKAYRGRDVDQTLLSKPQLVKISGGGLMRPLLLALPESINLAAAGSTELEKRVDPSDPSRQGTDVVMSSLTAEGSTLVYEQKIARRRGDGVMIGNSHASITSSSTRVIEMRGQRVGENFLVTSLAITVHEPKAGEKTVTQITVALAQPLALRAH